MAESTETWAYVPGLEGLYSASSLGRIRSEPRVDSSGKRRSRHVLSHRIMPHGYHMVGLHKNNSCVSSLVHRLVARAFIDNPDGRPCVNHIDGDKSNNRPSNLEWVTYTENATHASIAGLSRRKLSDAQVLAIYGMSKAGADCALLGRWFGVSDTMVRHIRDDRAYSWLTGFAYTESDGRNFRVENLRFVDGNIY